MFISCFHLWWRYILISCCVPMSNLIYIRYLVLRYTQSAFSCFCSAWLIWQKDYTPRFSTASPPLVLTNVIQKYIITMSTVASAVFKCLVYGALCLMVSDRSHCDWQIVFVYKEVAVKLPEMAVEITVALIFWRNVITSCIDCIRLKWFIKLWSISCNCKLNLKMKIE